MPKQAENMHFCNVFVERAFLYNVVRIHRKLIEMGRILNYLLTRAIACVETYRQTNETQVPAG